MVEELVVHFFCKQFEEKIDFSALWEILFVFCWNRKIKSSSS